MTQLLDPSNNQLESIEVRTPISGFLNIYDGDCLIQSIPVQPGMVEWHIYWSLSDGLSYVWDSSNEITVYAKISGQTHSTRIRGAGRVDVFTLVAPPLDEEISRVNIRGDVNPEQVRAEIDEARAIDRALNNARGVAAAIANTGISLSEAARGIRDAFQGMEESMGAISNLGSPPSPPIHPNCNSEIEAWRETTSSIRPSLFVERPEYFKNAINHYLAIHSREIINANKKFTWQTRGGEVLKIHEMQSTHLFYSMRMVYNNAVSSSPSPINWRPLTAGRIRAGDVAPITAHNPPHPGAKRSILVFMYHIEERKDLPLKCMYEYNNMLAEILDIDPITSNSCFGRTVGKDVANPTRRLLTDEVAISAKAKKTIQTTLKRAGLKHGKRRLNV